MKSEEHYKVPDDTVLANVSGTVIEAVQSWYHTHPVSPLGSGAGGEGSTFGLSS